MSVAHLEARPDQLVLKPSEESIGTILIQGSEAPVFSDTWDDGIDFVCGHCNDSVLARGVSEDQIWDVLFQCFICKRLSESPQLPPGRALPARYVYAPYGRYLLNRTVEMKRSVFAGQNAQAKRVAEAGEKGQTFGQKTSSSDLSAELLGQNLETLRKIVGEALDRLMVSDTLAQNSQTPPKHRNPLAEVVVGVREAAAALVESEPVIDARPIVELHSLLAILRRWQNHPLWAQLALALINEYSHTVITMAAASLLEDVGNGVMLHKSVSGRGADLMLVTGPRQQAAIEIKAPRVLRNRSTPLSHSESLEIVTKALKKAGTGGKGQLSRERPGLLVIGGFHLNDSDLDQLENACKSYLLDAARRKRHTQLLGISIVSVGVAAEAKFNAVGVVERRVSGALQVRIAKNAGYVGAITLSDEPLRRL